jgi:hypothetical protein
MIGPGASRRVRRIRGFPWGLAGPARLAVTLTFAGTLTAAVAGCGAAASGAAGTALPPVAPGQETTAPALAGVQLPDFVMPLINGPISRPNHAITPGDVVTTDTTAVCAMQVHGVRESIPSSIKAAVYAEYGYADPWGQHKYILNFLVPWDLGGALDEANIWPAAVYGTGFHQKFETDRELRALVCGGELSLRQAQDLEETDWYSAWLRYVVVAGLA